MDSFKRFSKEKLSDKKCFYSSVKDGTTGDDGEKLDGHISEEDYLTCKKHEKHGWLSQSLFEKKCTVNIWCFWKVYRYMLKILQTWSLSLFLFS